MSASFTLGSFFVTFLTMVLTIYVLYFTFQLLAPIDWTYTVTIFDATWLSPVFGSTPGF